MSMGELSKKIGEEGERIVMRFFERIGWSPMANGIDLPCQVPEKHKKKESDSARTTHGVDLGFSYVCPALPQIRRNVLISIKHSGAEDTRTCKQQIKDDLTDLSTALACFNRSKEKANFVSQGGGATSVEDHGILLKINKDPEGEKSFLGEISTRDPIDIHGHASLCFMENTRFDFVEKCFDHLELQFSGWNHSFVIARSSLNPSPALWKPFSSILPIQSLVAGPLVIRLDKKGAPDLDSELVIYSDEKFSIPGFKRLAGCAKVLSGNWVGVTIVFPDFQDVRDGTEVNQVLTGLDDKEFARSIRCESSDSRSRRG